MLLVGQVQQEHRDLYSQPWQRVYTTNYDDVPLISTKRSALTLSPVTLNSTVKGDWTDTNYCVYINGYIGRLNEETLKPEFRLSGESYIASDALNESEWGAVFSEDIETAECIVIIGLSLDYDLDIKRFIYNQKVVDKTIFIEKEGISSDKERKLKRLGNVYPIGMTAFVSDLIAYKETHTENQITTDTYIPVI